MLIYFLSLVCVFQLYFLKGELTARPKSSGPFYPKVYPHDMDNNLDNNMDNTSAIWIILYKLGSNTIEE